MSETCLHHPDVPTFRYDPWCESIWCKCCYDRMNEVFQKIYKSEEDRWIVREPITKEEAKKLWPDI